jgi:hypothetical protein
MRGNDCVALLSVTVAGPFYFTNRNGPSLEKFAQDTLNMDQKMGTVVKAQQSAQIGDLQPYTTASGWEGLKCVMTITTNTGSKQVGYYFFVGHGDTKILVETSCHADQVDRDTPLFESVVKSLVQE